jgi:predicted molibdopterin-dependent oxidoreductase YjgC
MESVESVCSFCSNGCTFDLNTRNGKVLKVSHREAPGVNEASLCAKGFFGYDTINHSDRILTPMVRKEGTLQETSWEEALDLLTRRFGEIAGGGKGDLVGGIASTRLTNEELFLFQKLFRTAFGSNNIDTPAGNWTKKVLPVLEERLGVWAAPDSVEGLADADAMLVVGCDITVSNPITGLKVKKALRNGAAVTEINPYSTPLARLGSRSLAVPVGSEIAFVKGMTKVILEEKLADSAGGKISNIADLEKSLSGKDLSTIAEEVGVGPEVIELAAREFAGGQKASVIFGETAALQAGGEKLIQALIDLMMLAGKLGAEGCGIYPVFPDANFQGAVDMGVDPSWLPGRAPVEKDSQGLSAGEMIQAAAEGRLKAMYLVGADPTAFVAGGTRVTEALGKLDFLVVQDLFLTEAAAKADVVLPAAGTAEKEGTLTSIERRVQKVHQAVPEPGKSMADWKVFSRIGEVLGVTGMGGASPDEILRDVSEAVPYYSGIDGSVLGDGGVQWPVSDGGKGTASLLENGIPGDKKKFAAVTDWNTGNPDNQYPFTLVAGDLLCHSGSYTRFSENLNKIHPSVFLLIHPSTAAESGVADGDNARVSSKNGEITVPVQYSTDLVPGALFLPRHFAEAGVSELADPGPDEGSSMSVVNVKVERA